jgi:hypothetical protein
LKELAEAHGVEWTLMHSFFVNMGGFAVRVPIQAKVKNMRKG